MVLPYSSLLAASVSDGAVCTVDRGGDTYSCAGSGNGVSRHDVVVHSPTGPCACAASV